MQVYNPRHCQSTNLRWKAIMQRDPEAHCSFLYGVRTTRVYCRPTCTARVARRANVVYFDTPAQAQLDGFRPCVKCRPDDSTFMGQREDIVMRTLGLLRDDVGCVKLEGGVKSLAQDVGVTPSYLCRVFKTVMGCTIGHYCRQFEAVQRVVDRTSAPGMSTSSAQRELPASAWLSKSVPPAEDCPTSVVNFPKIPSEDSDQSWTSLERSFDMDLDFDDWLWAEDLMDNH